MNGNKKLFNKEISPRCEYCKTGVPITGSSEILCKKTGVMQPDSYCKKFSYDPLKRKPKTVKISSDYSQEDFKL